jgi:hypothetical protein
VLSTVALGLGEPWGVFGCQAYLAKSEFGCAIAWFVVKISQAPEYFDQQNCSFTKPRYFSSQKKQSHGIVWITNLLA